MYVYVCVCMCIYVYNPNPNSIPPTEARKELLEEFVLLQLVPYDTLFGVGRTHCSLDQVDRRWSWFKRLLKYIDSKFGTIFPTHWRLPLRLCMEFTENTKVCRISYVIVICHMLYSVQCTVYSIQCTVYSRYQLYSYLTSNI
jgi:hypothetical protein